MMLRRFILTLGLLLLPATAAVAQLAPFKDKLFAYPKVLEQSSDKSYRLVEYDRERDMIKRDKIPRRKVHHRYVNTRVNWSRRVRSYQSPNGKFKHFEVGAYNGGARVTVIYVHGKGGNRRQGVNNFTFGGNFNRLQNLMTRNKGLLYTPDFSDFKNKGAADIAALMVRARKISPRTKLIVACGSMGGGVCWRLLQNKQTASMLDGIFILGSFWSDDFLTSNTIRKSTPNVPIYFGHGGSDPVFKPSNQLNFFRSILKTNPTYPARFVMFDTGAHGTPIRMVDWRSEINWMLSQ